MPCLIEGTQCWHWYALMLLYPCSSTGPKLHKQIGHLKIDLRHLFQDVWWNCNYSFLVTLPNRLRNPNGFLFGPPGSLPVGCYIGQRRPAIISWAQARLRNMPAEPLSTRLALAVIRHVRSGLSVAGTNTQQMPWSSFMGISFAMVIHSTMGILIWGLPKIGVPPNHPFLDGIFQPFETIYFGIPPFLETPSATVL